MCVKIGGFPSNPSQNIGRRAPSTPTLRSGGLLPGDLQATDRRGGDEVVDVDPGALHLRGEVRAQVGAERHEQGLKSSLHGSVVESTGPGFVGLKVSQKEKHNFAGRLKKDTTT